VGEAVLSPHPPTAISVPAKRIEVRKRDGWNIRVSLFHGSTTFYPPPVKPGSSDDQWLLVEREPPWEEGSARKATLCVLHQEVINYLEAAHRFFFVLQ
jgi:hypothetical protein